MAAAPKPISTETLDHKRYFFSHLGLTERLLEQAFALGQLRVVDLTRVKIAARALVYGFARMNLDGHLPRWGVADADLERTGEAIIDLFIEGIAAPSRTA